MSDWETKYYTHLVGAKIIGFAFEQGADMLDPFPTFTLDHGGQVFKLSLSMDEEGNSGGYGFIEPVDGGNYEND